jgi:hypothetical protein
MKKITLILSTTLLISACGGGGGGDTSLAPVIRPVFTGSVADFQTTEYNTQYGLGSINAANIYADGLAGLGVKVAVIDTGVDLDHPDLVGNIATGGFDYLDMDSNANPSGQGSSMSHGTHIAGIIAGRKDGVGMHGVAYDASILAFRAGNSDGDLFGSAIVNSINDAIGKGAKVINASFGGGSFDSTTANAWKNAYNNDIITVHAAGNDGNAEVDFGAKIPSQTGYGDLANGLIAVVAVDSSNNIASYSNRCGASKNWCMAAPGSGIYSTVSTDDNNYAGNYANFDGTSMATPHVSGAVALLRSKWPSKTATEITTILYDTATDLGVVGVDDIYGRGLLNLNNAIFASGILSVKTLNGANYDLQNTSITTSSVLGNALDDDFSLAVFDKYQRDYHVKISPKLQTKITKNTLLDELRRSFKAQTHLKLTQNFNDKYLTLSYQKNSYQAPGNNTKIIGLSDDYQLHNNPYLAQIQTPFSLSLSHKNNKSQIDFISGWTSQAQRNSINALNASFSTQAGAYLQFKTQLSHLREKQTFLANDFSGAYQVGSSYTNAINLSGVLDLSKNLSIKGGYNQGITRVKTQDNSLISGISSLTTQGYSVSLTRKNIISQNDKLFIAFQKPLKVNAGVMDLTYANGLNLDDSIIWKNQRVNLAPQASERTLSLGWMQQNQGVNSAILLNHVSNPNHSKGKSESQIILKFNKAF